LKKFLVLLSAIALAIGLTACSNNNEAKTDKQESKEEATAPKVDIKKELVKFYMDLGNKINAKDADLNAYIAKATKEDAKPEELPTAEDKAKASEAAAAVAAELNNYQVLAELNDKKADLESAIKDYAASYQTKADELKKDVPNLDAASASLTKAEEKLGKVFESEDLLAPSLDKQVN
jgi:ABC-type glycerol-3-phosphate transport system substrate-binding protein